MTPEQDALVLEHRAWAEGIGRSVWRHSPRTFDVEDLKAAGVEGLIKAAIAYDPARNDCFPAFAHVYVQGECWMAVRRRAYTFSQCRELPEQTATPPSSTDAEAALQMAQLADVLRQGAGELTERQQVIIRERYFSERLMVDIAQELGIGVTTAHTEHRAALAALREHFQRFGRGIDDFL